MSTWQDFQNDVSAQVSLFTGKPDLLDAFQKVYAAAKSEDRTATDVSLYLLMDEVRRKVQPPSIDAAVNTLMKSFHTVEAKEGEDRPMNSSYVPQVS